jgi:hypothetical protein
VTTVRSAVSHGAGRRETGWTITKEDHPMRHSKGLVPNRGGGPARRRPPERRAAYLLRGSLRYVDRAGAVAALLVQDGNGLGRRLVGRTLTLDLATARVTVDDRDGDGTRTVADLLAGDRVTVSARLPRRLDELPASVPVRRMAVSPLPATI